MASGGSSADAWSLKEELLLVCAAKLHRHESWETIAMEVQNKSNRSEHFFTPRKCIDKFRNLHQQIIGGTSSDNYTFVDEQTLDYMVEVLKKRRIDELTREIELEDKEILARELHLKSLLEGKAKASTDEVQEEDLMVVDEEVKITKESNRKSNSKQVRIDVPDPAQNLRKQREGIKVESHCQKMMKGVLRKLRRQRELTHIFEHRIRIQKTEDYKKMVRQHMDLETIQTKLDKDEYETSFHRFFLDLLLLVNNAIVFFGKNSEEHKAALQLRDIIKTEMNKIIPNPFLGRETVYVKDVPRGVPVLALCAQRRRT